MIEMLMERWEVPDVVQPVPHFEGETLPWEDRPSWMPNDNISCAHLVCEPDGTARLYMDQRSRCNPAGLGLDAMKLHKQFSKGRLDSGWTRRRDGLAWTGITTHVIGKSSVSDFLRLSSD
ncbi:MAG: hypothetical protein ACR2I7_06995 [Geodermatophilaceae bacterium]